MSNTGPITIRELAEMFYAMQQQQEAAAAEAEANPEAALMPMLTGEQQNFAGAIPSYDLEGDPYSINQQLNQLQDVTDLLADPMFQAGGGPGGYSIEAFQPNVTWEQVDSPEYYRYKNYQNTPDSFEGMVAAELDGGGTPLSALRKIQAKIAENPEGAVAQQLLMFFPANIQGEPTGEIDWTLASQAATEIDDLRSQIPQLGEQAILAPDGTRIGGGEIVEVQGPDGRMQLLRRVEEPSPMMEKFEEQGLPSPFEEYTAESFLGPEWAASNEAFAAGQGDIDVMTQAMQEAFQNWQNYSPAQANYPIPAAAPEEEPINMVGTTEDVPLVEGPGMPETRAVAPGEGGWYGDTLNAPAGYDERMRWTDPDAFEEWYNANANTMTDEQRMSVIADLMTRGDQQMNGIGDIGVRQQGLEMVQLAQRLQDDMEEFSPEPATEVIGAVASDVGDFLSGGEREPTAAEAATAEAMQIHDPLELRNYLNEHPEIPRDSYADIGAQALSYSMGDIGPAADQLGALASELMSGDFTPTGGAGGTGTRPQVRGLMGAQTLGPNAKLPADAVRKLIERSDLSPEQAAFIQDSMWDALTGEQPEPPPEDLTWAGGPTELFGGGGRETPAPPGAAPLNLLAGPPGGGRDWFTAEPPGDVSEDAWRDYLLSALLPQYAVGTRANELEDEAIRTGEAITRPRPTSAPGSEGAPWVGPPNAPPGSEGAPWTGPLNAPPGAADQFYQNIIDVFGVPPQRPTTGDYLLNAGMATAGEPWPGPPTTGDYLLNAGMATAGEPRRGAPTTGDYLLNAGMATAGREVPRPTTGDYLLNMGMATAGEPVPRDTVTSEAMRDYVLSSILPTAPATERAGELQQEALHEGARRRSISNLQQNEAMLQAILPSIRTGERTAEERRELARERAPKDLQGEEYEPTTGMGGGLGLGRKRTFQEAYKRRSHALVARQRERNQLYGASFGQAMRAVRNAQLSGASPLQQVYAQRMSNILNAGVPLGNQPGLVQY